MSRPGVTLQDCEAAYDRIEARGEYPSAKRIWEELGRTGSMTTINAHLQTFRAKRASKSALEEMESISPDLVKTVMKLHGQLQAVATSEIAKSQQQFSQQLKAAEDAQTELQAKLEASLAQIARLEQDLVVARSMYDSEREALVASREKVAALDNKVSGQTEDINDLKSRLQVSQEETRRAIAQREHYQAAMAEERKREHAEHANAIAHMQAQNEALTREVVAKTEQQSQASIRISTLELEVASAQAANAELRASQTRLNDLVSQRDTTIDDLRQKLDAAVIQEREAGRQAARANAELAEARQSLAVTEVRMTHLESENAGLRDDLKTLKAAPNPEEGRDAN